MLALFNVFRVFLWLAIIAVVFIWTKKSAVKKRGLIISLVALLSFALITVASVFPIENLFISFQSPENVFNYAENGEVDEVIYGKESCMVIYSNDKNTRAPYFTPKKEKGYKIPSYFGIKRISQKFDQDGLFNVYHVLGTDDYYIVGFANADSLRVDIYSGDNVLVANTKVITIKSDSNSIRFYSYIENFTTEYYLLIDGKRVHITNVG